MLIHDVIKIRLTNDGYLANYPYHMMSDREMFTAFIGNNPGNYFTDNYPCLDKTNDVLKILRNQLALSVLYYTAMYQAAEQAIPDWVYSYMLGSTISIYSDKLDIHDLNAQLHTENDSDEFTLASSVACMQESAKTLGYVTINQVTAIPLEAEKKQAVEDIFRNVMIDTDLSAYDLYHNNGDVIYVRPVSVFGEPHVLKSLRLRQISL